MVILEWHVICVSDTYERRHLCINFAPPTNWNVKSENGSATKYWVKGTVSGCSTLPVASRIYGASWYRVALANNRVLGGDAPFGAIHVELAVPASGLIVTWQTGMEHGSR